MTDAEARSFSEYAKTEYIPLLLVTRDGNVELCISDVGDKGMQAYKDACTQFNGVFNEATGVCEGVADSLIQKTAENFCAPNGVDNCTHPYKDQTCDSSAYTDIRGVAYGNWVVDGYSSQGTITCSCVPRPCPDTDNACFGEDLGTDWCNTVCPVGTKKNEDCCPPWTPSPATVCDGAEFVQNNGTCGLTRRDMGTAPHVWQPDASTVCLGTSFTQTRTCDGATRDAVGTMPVVWSPNTNTKCSGTPMTQTKTCDGTTRSATGTRDCTCYGGVLYPGCNFPNGTLGDTASFSCNSGGADRGSCSADCRVSGSVIRWVGSSSCRWDWSVGPWGSCSGGRKTRSVTCPKPGYCSGSKPATSSTDGCPAGDPCDGGNCTYQTFSSEDWNCNFAPSTLCKDVFGKSCSSKGSTVDCIKSKCNCLKNRVCYGLTLECNP